MPYLCGLLAIAFWSPKPRAEGSSPYAPATITKPVSSANRIDTGFFVYRHCIYNRIFAV